MEMSVSATQYQVPEMMDSYTFAQYFNRAAECGQIQIGLRSHPSSYENKRLSGGKDNIRHNTEYE